MKSLYALLRERCGPMALRRLPIIPRADGTRALPRRWRNSGATSETKTARAVGAARALSPIRAKA
jgi:hypothetical protein